MTLRISEAKTCLLPPQCIWTFLGSEDNQRLPPDAMRRDLTSYTSEHTGGCNVLLRKVNLPQDILLRPRLCIDAADSLIWVNPLMYIRLSPDLTHFSVLNSKTELCLHT
jgi:hypothetical protein